VRIIRSIPDENDNLRQDRDAIEGDDKELGSSGIPIGRRNGRYHIATRCPKP